MRKPRCAVLKNTRVWLLFERRLELPVTPTSRNEDLMQPSLNISRHFMSEDSHRTRVLRNRFSETFYVTFIVTFLSISILSKTLTNVAYLRKHMQNCSSVKHAFYLGERKGQ